MTRRETLTCVGLLLILIILILLILLPSKASGLQCPAIAFGGNLLSWAVQGQLGEIRCKYEHLDRAAFAIDVDQRCESILPTRIYLRGRLNSASTVLICVWAF